MSEYLDPVLKAHQCAQKVDDTGIVAIPPEKLITDAPVVFKCIQRARFYPTVAKCHFGTKKLIALDEITHQME